MLELIGIKKDYLAGENTVHALKGIDLKFRSSEFVSILGPSGCGKTTMLNIIGGLDQYTDGDLIINGRSTKDFKDRDWDTYRNHSVGFVFQSYNLIPHQTVLQNVELALTLSGVGKSERKARAKKALEEVGLGNQLHKRPSEMSGGQMQRVAIARALVNNPDIILADEPTGALDTETSVQVMEILKKISKDRLIVMVTHNPELAQKYSTRIIRMLDGNITDDSSPLTPQENQEEELKDKNAMENAGKQKKPSMSFFTAFMLSLKNLFTKKGRTLLTAFAGSIGIIGIALILSISEGLTEYIDTVQEEALSSYPLQVQAQSIDLTALMETFMTSGKSDSEHEKDAVYKHSAIYDMMNSLNSLEVQENDLRAFKTYLDAQLEDTDSKLSDATNGIQYSYGLDLQVYTKNVDGDILKSDASKLMQNLLAQYMGIDPSAMSAMTGESSVSSGSIFSTISSSANRSTLWQELLTGENGDPVNDLLKKQYDIVYGSWPNSYDEVVLVLDRNNEINDIVLYALGLESKETINAIMDAAMKGTELVNDNKHWSYEEICAMEYKVILNSSCYTFDEQSGVYTDLRTTDAGLSLLYNNAIPIKVVGIIRPSEDATTTMLTGSIGYTKMLTEYVIEQSKNAGIIAAQKESKNIDILTGLPFPSENNSMSKEEKKTFLLSYIDELDDAGKAAMYLKIKSALTDEELNDAVSLAMANVTSEQITQTVMQVLMQQMGMSQEDVSAYMGNMSEEDIKGVYTTIVKEQLKMQNEEEVKNKLSTVSNADLSKMLTAELSNYTDDQFALYYDSAVKFSESTYEKNLLAFGDIDLENPSAINIYASSFAKKDDVEDVIADYNEGVEELQQIKYTDYVGIMMSSVSTIIDAITYVLIAFVSISLIVSSIMIGVITLISVQERTKEIGILRAIGASKHDVSSMFNAETIIIGFAAGLLGVLVTYLLCIPINIIIHSVTDINNLNAFLPFGAAIVLILISMGLTLLSGFIPSKSAAKKDPVVALRSE